MDGLAARALPCNVMALSTSTPPPLNEIAVRDFATDPRLGLRLDLVAGTRGMDRPVLHPRVQKSGLALAGHFQGVVPGRVQLLGDTELSYLDALSHEARSEASRGFLALGLSCVVLTRQDASPPRELILAADATQTPLVQSSARSSRTINAIHAVLDDLLAPQTKLHGVLVDVFGVGILLLGKSGIGKSEAALELVMRGHRLVADDVVVCDWRPPGMIFGAAADLLRYHVEVRGLGILNVQEMFGVTAVRERKRVDVVVQLEEWDASVDYDRLGIEDEHHTILGTPIRRLRVPVRPARDMGSILEMAARNELLRRAGRHPAREFLQRLEAQRTGKGLPPLPTPDEGLEDARPPNLLAIEPESVCDAPVRERDPFLRRITPSAIPKSPPPIRNLPHVPAAPPPPPSSGHHLRPLPATGESSAWIPAVRPKGGDE